jgi:hypothetical protein
VVFAALAVVLTTGVVTGIGRELAVVPAGFALVLLIVVVVSAIRLRTTDATRTALAQDATARGFDYDAELRGLGLPGLLFRTGERTSATDVIDARSTPTPFIAGGLSGQYGTDTSTPRIIATSFVAIPLPRTVPNIVLLGAGFGAMKLAGVAIASHQRLSLEGDFDKNFTLYCPAGYERDALEIFTPDLMHLLIETTSGCDVELVDDWMFVYSRAGRYRDPAALDALVAVTQLVQKKLHRQTSGYRDSRSAALAGAHRTVSPDEHAARAGRVATAGARVHTRATLFQRAVTIASTLLLLVAVVSGVLSAIH